MTIKLYSMRLPSLIKICSTRSPEQALKMLRFRAQNPKRVLILRISNSFGTSFLESPTQKIRDFWTVVLSSTNREEFQILSKCVVPVLRNQLLKSIGIRQKGESSMPTACNSKTFQSIFFGPWFFIFPTILYPWKVRKTTVLIENLSENQKLSKSVHGQESYGSQKLGLFQCAYFELEINHVATACGSQILRCGQLQDQISLKSFVIF